MYSVVGSYTFDQNQIAVGLLLGVVLYIRDPTSVSRVQLCRLEAYKITFLVHFLALSGGIFVNAYSTRGNNENHPSTSPIKGFCEGFL